MAQTQIDASLPEQAPEGDLGGGQIDRTLGDFGGIHRANLGSRLATEQTSN
jgi:hypothetical protein